MKPRDGLPGLISVSIVSHGQGALLAGLVEDLVHHCPRGLELILTLNLPEPDPAAGPLPFELRLLRNAAPKGFAANHNAAHDAAQGEFFCVMNPDVRFDANPFPPLLEELTNPAVGVVAPLILDPSGKVEDSARPFPTPLDIVRKALGRAPGRYYEVSAKSISPDWVAGMFMLFRAKTFAEVGGFDPAYHLYYEDVDLCARLRAAGRDVRLVPGVPVTHHARRQSRRNLSYMAWHLRSMLRFFLSGVAGKATRSRPR